MNGISRVHFFGIYACLLVLITGCYSNPELWRRDKPNQVHLIRTSSYGDIWMSKDVLFGNALRPDLTDSCRPDFSEQKCKIDSLPMSRWIADGDYTISIYRRDFQDFCGEPGTTMTHILIIGENHDTLQPDQTIHAIWGCEPWVLYHRATSIIRTDSSILITTRSRNQDEHHPYWFEILNRQE